MEQHYVIVFTINHESAFNLFTLGVIIDKYPGGPAELLRVLCKTVEDNSEKLCNKFIPAHNIVIQNLTLVFQK